MSIESVSGLDCGNCGRHGWLRAACFALAVLSMLPMASPPTRAAESGAQSGAEAFWKSLQGITAGEATAIACESATKGTAGMTAFELLTAAAQCQANKRNVDATVLYLLGQVRAVADMAYFQPASQSDERSVSDLYALIYWNFGGVGSPEVYRDATATTIVLDALLRWSLSPPKDYSPGWKSRVPFHPVGYGAYLDDARLERWTKMSAHAVLMTDAEYVKDEQTLGALRTRNPKGFQGGTADAESASELTNRMTDKESRALDLITTGGGFDPETLKAHSELMAMLIEAGPGGVQWDSDKVRDLMARSRIGKLAWVEHVTKVRGAALATKSR